MKNYLLLFPLLALIGCPASTEKAAETKQEIFWVNSLKVPCTGVAPMHCLQIQRGNNLQEGKWEVFYSDIEGFDYQTGDIYKLLVKIEELKPEEVPADGSSLRYTLVEILEKKPDPGLRLHDIWAVERIQGIPFKMKQENSKNERPVLEIHLADKKILGNDGCNQFFGEIAKLTDTAIQFDKIGGTEMACPDMTTPQQFTAGLSQTASYKIGGLKLYFFNKKGEEVLSFQKVD